jgi:hypothetical protein
MAFEITQKMVDIDEKLDRNIQEIIEQNSLGIPPYFSENIVVGEKDEKKLKNNTKKSRAEKYIEKIEKKLNQPSIAMLMEDYHPSDSERETARKIGLSIYLIKYCKQKRPSHKGLKLFLDQGADPKYKKSRCLIYACMTCSCKNVRYLLKKGAEITDLHEMFIGACRFGKFNTVKYLYINHNALITNEAIEFAAMTDSIPTVKFLHENGADISVNNNMPLQYAVSQGNVEMVKYIISILREKGIPLQVDKPRTILDSSNIEVMTISAFDIPDPGKRLQIIDSMLNYGLTLSVSNVKDYEKLKRKVEGKNIHNEKDTENLEKTINDISKLNPMYGSESY